MGKLPRSFYERPSPDLARDLLGKVLLRSTPAGLMAGRIVEVEAYTGETDPGSHAYRGPTPRNRVMFGPPGYVYVYKIYAVHFCMNVVGETAGVAGAVLLRALEPLQGVELMEQRRGGRPVVDLCNGPGKLCQALGITREQNGADLEGPDLWIEDNGYGVDRVSVTTRVGLSRGKELPLRFYIAGNPYVSRGKPSAPMSQISGGKLHE